MLGSFIANCVARKIQYGDCLCKRGYERSIEKRSFTEFAFNISASCCPCVGVICCDENLAIVIIQINFERKSLFHLFVAIYPISMIDIKDIIQFNTNIVGSFHGQSTTKTQVLQIFFSHHSFCRAFAADHFRKKSFLNRPFFPCVIGKILSKSC